MNANRSLDEEFVLPEGEWDILVSPEKAGTKTLGTLRTSVIVKPSSGYVLKKR
jgi:hypothetical protein